MILAVALALAAESPQARARTHFLVAVWAEAHGDRASAERAATTALLHDPDAAAPRALLARLREGEPGGTGERLRWLEEAVQNPEADAATWTALGRARAAAGQADAAAAAYAESDRRGPTSANFAAWLQLLEGDWSPDPNTMLSGEVLRIELTERWYQMADPGPGGHALRATWASSPAQGFPWHACTDADLATRLGEPIEPRVVLAHCAPAGRIRTARRALARLAGRVPADALAEARAHLAAAEAGTADAMGWLRLPGFPATLPTDPTICPLVVERWPSDSRLRGACVKLGGWPR